ncbi:phosducin-like protein 3, partial [Leptotrombidium deliense]
EDTQWNRILVEKGILKAPEEWMNNNSCNKCEQSDENELKKSLDDLFDDDDEDAIREYRMKRLQEMKLAMYKKSFGEVYEITKQDYVQEVNKAGEGVFVVLHVYKPGIILCSLINEHYKQLAKKFPYTKFIKSISSLCIPNFPDENLPAIFVYCDGQVKKQYIGASAFGNAELRLEELEWILSQSGAFETDLESDPRTLRQTSKTFLGYNDSDDDD